MRPPLLPLLLLCAGLALRIPEPPAPFPEPDGEVDLAEEDPEDLEEPEAAGAASPPAAGEGDPWDFAALRQRRGKVLRDTVFKNVLLVVHCRVKSRRFVELVKNHSLEFKTVSRVSPVCWERQALFAGYAEFFPEAVYLHNDNCALKRTNPHNCLAGLLERADRREGLLYLHFDALLRPARLARAFDPAAIATFQEQRRCRIGPNGTMPGCRHWGPWGAVQANYLRALDGVEAAGVPVDRGSFWLGMDDLFYIPRSVFGGYRELAQLWTAAGVHHEVAGPTTWALLRSTANVSVVDLACTGSCCAEVRGEEALSPGFGCGHPFRLSEEENRQAFVQAMVMD